ncbi:polysaccharide pyruvyl transferase family protein [Gordonia amicalis]|uniref:polysaccharide pyruvyl transferase family protein n=1 Tax=Gordonia amicalis TaxID=89053 RepID=UPI002954021C|nr:polysaccharide pyruvyl transferase family protein [Gordonia amicalis]MDV7102423.1 polysaccharide pyruvyl transferase family protein [Gordonia amicalis]
MYEASDLPVRVLILWSDPCAQNLGLRILAEGAQALAELVWGRVDVTFHSHNTSETPLSKKSVLTDLGRSNGSVKDYFRRFDVILDTGGGDSFSDIYGLRRLALQAYMYRAAAVADVPIVMTPQTVGPFRTVRGKALARLVLNSAQFCAVRDATSARLVTTIRNRPPEAIATDMVFLGADSKIASAVPVPVDRSPRKVLVNVSGLLWTENEHTDFLKYRSSVRELLTSLIESGFAVGLLAHVLDAPLTDNDVPVVRELAKEFDGIESVVPASLSDARVAVASASVVVGSRMHACLNALSVGTPAIAWAYSRKFEPLLSSLGWPHVIDLRTESDIVSRTLLLLNTVSEDDLRSLAAHAAVEGRRKFGELVAGLRSAHLVGRESMC